METVELTNVGPIEKLSIPVPDAGGVVVLRGANGLGKSHAIAGVQAMADPAVRRTLRNRDNTREGRIEGLGVSVRLGRSNTSKGELAVSGLDSVMDPAAFVDPGIKDPDLADAKRVQVLARLAGIKVEREEWLALFDDSVSVELLGINSEDLDGDDPVETANKLRRKLHDAARRIEKSIEGMQARADVAGKDLPADLPESIDRDAFHAAVARAEANVASLRRMVADDERIAQQAEQARQQLESIVVEDVEQILAEIDLNKSAAGSNDKLASELTEQIAVLTAQRDGMLATAWKHRERIVELEARAARAAEQKRRVEELRDTMTKATRKPVEPAEIEKAAAEVAEAKAALEAAIVAQEAIRRRDDWKAKVAELSQQRKIADRIREIARSTDSAIEHAFATRGFEDLVINDGRLCVATDRGKEPVSDLSHGERWRLALDIASRNQASGALLAVNQEAWESLDPTNRRLVAGMAKDRGIVILTAEASEGELRAEPFEV